MFEIRKLFTTLFLLIHVGVGLGLHQTVEFTVGLSWDGKQNVSYPAKIYLTSRSEDVELSITAHFYDDPPPPDGKPGESYWQLWNYEVVEAFFLNLSDEYLELEFGPHGQYLLLMLHGQRNAIKYGLPLEYSSKIDRDTNVWTATAIIPGSYFPPDVKKFNGYAIHGTEEQGNRVYEAVFPVPGDVPDFHRIDKFGDFDLSTILPSNNGSGHSDTWIDALLEAGIIKPLQA